MLHKLKTGLLTIVLISTATFAQSIEDGIRQFSYENYESAKNTFAKDSQNPLAVYWLGQTMLRQKANTQDVRTLYSNALAQNPKSDLLKIGLSHLDILDDKLNDAKATQISILKNTKDMDLYAAAARAQLWNKKGDADFAIQFLTKATEINKKKDETIPLLLALAYLKKQNTSDATLALIQANDMDTYNAEPLFLRARMYNNKSNPENEKRFLEYMFQVVNKDPNFAPAYYDLFYYYYDKDKEKAKNYFQKYQNLADKTPELEYITANVNYNLGDYAKAIELSLQALAKYGDKVSPKFYKVLAHANLDTNNLTEANKYLTEYLSKVDKSEINYGDYMEVAKIANKLNDEPTIATMLNNAMQLCNNNGERYNVAQLGISIYKPKVDANEKDDVAVIPYRTELAKWYETNYYNHHNPSNVDLYNFGLQNYLLKNWIKTNEAFSKYAEKYPTQVQGFFFSGMANKFGLNDMTKAEENFKKVVEIGMQDAANNKFFLTQSLIYLADLASSDKAKVREYANQILSYDPENEAAKQLLK